jgi:GNAT superfamily N-acetyltransferase
MRPETKTAVDRFWADLFGLSIEELHAPGTKALQHHGLGDYPAVYVLILGRSVIVSSPADPPAGELAKVLGPSVHSYLDTRPAMAADGVREASYEELEPLRAAGGEDNWQESGFAEKPERCFVIEQNGKIVAASNLTLWRGEAVDVGVLVDPTAAGRGLGTRVAAAAADAAIQTAGICRYRALETNAPSLRIAEKLGFTPYGRNLVLKQA